MLCFLSLCRTHCLCFSYLFCCSCLCLFFFSPLVCLRCVVDLVQPFQQLQKVQLWLQAFLHFFKELHKIINLQSTFTFSTSWSCHLKLTVFFLSKRQEFNLWKIGSPIIFLYRPAPFACSWCFSSESKVKIFNLL